MSDRVVVYHWHEVEKHLREELDRVGRAMASADSEREMWRLQGRAQQLHAMIALPDTLTVLRGE